MRALIFIAMLSALSIFSCASGKLWNKNEEVICWSKHPLKWKDYSGRVPRTTPNDALTFVKFSQEILSKNTIVVKACFEKSKSWVKKDEMTPSLLRHEQYHFNLAEVFARKMRQDLSKVGELSTRNVDSVLTALRELHLEEQAAYDSETEHSKILAAQALWESRIDSLLISLEDYSNAETILHE